MLLIDRTNKSKMPARYQTRKSRSWHLTRDRVGWPLTTCLTGKRTEPESRSTEVKKWGNLNRLRRGLSGCSALRSRMRATRLELPSPDGASPPSRLDFLQLAPASTSVPEFFKIILSWYSRPIIQLVWSFSWSAKMRAFTVFQVFTLLGGRSRLQASGLNQDYTLIDDRLTARSHLVALSDTSNC